MKLYVVRHGETTDNSAGIIQGQLESDLNEIGGQQAATAAKQLSDIKFNQAWSSDLRRAVDTAKIIVKPHVNLKLQTSKLLREYNFGIYQGKPTGSWHWPNSPNSLDLKITGGESASQLAARLIDFLNNLLQTSPNDTILIVTHGGPARILRSLINKVPLGQIIETPTPHAQPTILELTRPINLPDLIW